MEKDQITKSGYVRVDASKKPIPETGFATDISPGTTMPLAEFNAEKRTKKSETETTPIFPEECGGLSTEPEASPVKIGARVGQGSG